MIKRWRGPWDGWRQDETKATRAEWGKPGVRCRGDTTGNERLHQRRSAVMGVELREPGRWIRDEHSEGNNTVDSVNRG